MRHVPSDKELCPLCAQKLLLAHPRLQTWFTELVAPNFPDAHISWTYRGENEQNLFFSQGKTNLKFPNSKHNQSPSLAIDLFQLTGGNAKWPDVYFEKIAALSKQHPEYGVKWSGEWKNFKEKDHFEIGEN